MSFRFVCFFLLLCLLSSAADAAVLNCDATQNGVRSASSLEILDQHAEVSVPFPEGNADLSLASSGLLYILQDDSRSLRTAFSGNPLGGLSSGGAVISQSGSQIQCALAPAIALEPVQRVGTFFTCFLDEIFYDHGVQVKSARMLKSTTSAAGLSQEVSAKNGSYSYEVSFNRYDHQKGLNVSLVRIADATTSGVVAPAETLKKAFLLAQTHGKRDEQATLLRLACIFTNNPGDY